jgi:hypothetical protein
MRRSVRIVLWARAVSRVARAEAPLAIISSTRLPMSEELLAEVS